MSGSIGRAVVLLALAGCGGGAPRGRHITLVSTDRRVDAALSTARQEALAGNLDRAQESLEFILRNRPRDPVCPAARALEARVVLARGDPQQAAGIARTIDASEDPTLARTRDLVLGIAAARAHDDTRALALLRPLDGQLPDRGESAELACGLADAEARSGNAARALHQIALTESLERDAVQWLPTGLACDETDTRAAFVAGLLPRIHDPQTLADALDALQPEAPLRGPIAERLRALAEDSHELNRWVRYLADLSDEAPAGAAPGAARSQRLVIGVLAPASGPRSVVGVSILRGVQFGLEGIDNVRSVPDDEGDTPDTAVAALDRLAGQGAQIVVGVAREDLSAAVAIRAQALGIDLWLLAPADGVEGAGRRVHVAGPNVSARADALVAAARGHGTHASLVVPMQSWDVHERVEQRLAAAGISVSRDRVDEITPQVNSSGLHLVAGLFGREARLAFNRAAEHAPSQWIFEARVALAGGAGTWIGIPAGPAFASLLATYCTRVGEPPDELGLLAHDAVRNAVRAFRGDPDRPMALAEGRPIVSAVISRGAPSAGATVPAAAARCSDASPAP